MYGNYLILSGCAGTLCRINRCIMVEVKKSIVILVKQRVGIAYRYFGWLIRLAMQLQCGNANYVCIVHGETHYEGWPYQRHTPQMITKSATMNNAACVRVCGSILWKAFISLTKHKLNCMCIIRARIWNKGTIRAWEYSTFVQVAVYSAKPLVCMFVYWIVGKSGVQIKRKEKDH